MNTSSSSATTYSSFSQPWPIPGTVANAPHLAEALAAFQKTLPQVGKNMSADAGRRGSYEYAGLDTVAQRVLPKLAAHGLSYICYPHFSGDKFVLGYALLHTSGEYVAGVFPIPIVSEAQTMGSWLTYARRYCLLAVTGVHPGGEDDDGAAAVTPVPAPAADYGAGAEASHRPLPAPESGAATTGGEDTAQDHVNENAQVLASLAQELLKRDCSLNELKEQVYEVAKSDRLLRANVINPFTGGMGSLSSVITYVRNQIQQRNSAARDDSDGY